MTPDQVPNQMTPADYVRWVKRSESPSFAMDKVPDDALVRVLAAVVAAADALNYLKRAYFYPSCSFDRGIFGAMLAKIRGTTQIAAPEDWHGKSIMSLSAKDGTPEAKARMFHAALGVCTEAGEIAELLYRDLFDPAVTEDTHDKWVEEWGDLNWYNALGSDAMGVSLDYVVWPGNIRKLVKRYPDKFDDDAASGERDYDAERAAMHDAGALEPPREWTVLNLDEATTSGMRLTEKAWQAIDDIPVGAVRDFREAMDTLAKHVTAAGRTAVPGIILSNLDIPDDIPGEAILCVADGEVKARLS